MKTMLRLLTLVNLWVICVLVAGLPFALREHARMTNEISYYRGKYSEMQAQWYNCLSERPMLAYFGRDLKPVKFECKEIAPRAGAMSQAGGPAHRSRPLMYNGSSRSKNHK